MDKLPVYKTEGIILKTADWGDLDRLLTIYTRSYGKIQARAISARKKESKLNGLMQSFTQGQFLLVKSKTIDIVTDLSVIDSYHYLHANLESLGYAWYFSELIDKLIIAPERDEDVWRLISRAFEVLNQKRNDLPKIKIAFEDKLLEFLGHPSPSSYAKATEDKKLWMASHSLSKNYGAANHPSSIQRLNYLQSLAGERINAQKFLAQIN